MGIIQGVIDKASEGQTSTFLASQNLETTGPAYEYGRQAMCDMFQLTLAGREKLKECDDKLKEAIQFRLNTEMESAESAMEQCYALLSMLLMRDVACMLLMRGVACTLLMRGVACMLLMKSLACYIFFL